MRIAFVLLATVGLVPVAPPPAAARTTAAQGVLAAQQLLGQVPAPGFCATSLAVAAAEARQAADPLQGRLLAAALQRPLLARRVRSPSGHFLVHYDTSGRDAVDPTDADGNGIPDYVDLAAAVADSVWHLEVDVLGYRQPPRDNGAGGGDEVDIYLVDLGRIQNYGITYPMSNGAAGPSYIQLDNNFTDPIYGNTFICPGHRGTRGADALRVTLAHEFFHVVQFGYYQGSDGSWWQEASATWMEDVAYPDLDDYLQYVCAFLQPTTPGRSLDSGVPSADFHAYGAAVFAHFLDQRYGRDVIRRIWEELRQRRNARLENFDTALVNYNAEVHGVGGVGLEAAVSELAVWSWFVGERARAGYFAEGEKYSAPFVPVFDVAVGSVASDSGRVDHMASRYLRFEPRLLPGGISLTTRLARGRWRRQLLLITADSVEVRDLGRLGGATLSGWDAYDEVVLVLSNVDVVGLGFDYRVDVEYDPDLIDSPAPLAMVLEAPVPNPFRPRQHATTLIAFDLDVASSATRLSLFSAAGDLVFTRDLGPRAARRHTVRWDGTNQDGTLVGTGIYYAVLEADGGTRRRALALIR